MDEKSDLENLKEDYAELQKKYSLPKFDDINKDFGVERISECETDFLLREIRKFVAEKFTTYLRFIESLLNPVNVPMFVFSVVKSLGVEEREKLTDAYKKIAKYEVELIALDMEFSEEAEAKFVLESYDAWQEVKKTILETIEVVKKNWDNKTKTNGKNYFG